MRQSLSLLLNVSHVLAVLGASGELDESVHVSVLILGVKDSGGVLCFDTASAVRLRV